MFTEERRVAGEIMDLLKKRAGPVRIKDIADEVSTSAQVINLSISRLVRDQLIVVEARDGENVVVMVVHEVSSI